MDAEDIAKKLKPFRQLVDDAAVERELEAELQKDYLFASALHGHKMSLVKQDRGPSPPPAPTQHRKIRRTDLNIGIIDNLRRCDFLLLLFNQNTNQKH